MPQLRMSSNFFLSISYKNMTYNLYFKDILSGPREYFLKNYDLDSINESNFETFLNIGSLVQLMTFLFHISIKDKKICLNCLKPCCTIIASTIVVSNVEKIISLSHFVCRISLRQINYYY